MKFFGLAHCPYCKKRINIVRIWSLKKKGEYMCPRCSGISNVYQSPLIYIFALAAIAISFLIYIFNDKVFHNISFWTPILTIIPYLGFYVVSLFLIHLETIKIKRVKKDANGRFFDETGKEYKMKFGKLTPVKK